jgi:caffeoyl-CoA O-methyltransferase
MKGDARMKLRVLKTTIFLLLLSPSFPAGQVHSQEAGGPTDLDKKVQAFLDRHAGRWHDMNVPAADGKILYDLVLKRQYRKALEIGTSTGHSAIWIAWALSKTGGKLITIEIDESRYETAVSNFKEAGLSNYIDARLADAHELVPKLEGPFDFVFCDADKDWYKNYFVAVAPKLEVGGCYTAHNVSDRGWASYGTGEFYQYVRGLKNFETTIDRSSRSGLSVSFKKSEK